MCENRTAGKKRTTIDDALLEALRDSVISHRFFCIDGVRKPKFTSRGRIARRAPASFNALSINASPELQLFFGGYLEFEMRVKTTCFDVK